MSTFDRRHLLTGTGILALGVLAGCGEEAPPPAVPTGPKAAGPTPINTEPQLAAVLKDIHAAVKKADKARDVKKLGPRVTGSAKTFRKGAYDLAKTDKDFGKSLMRPGAKAMVAITSTGEKFPRTALAMVEADAKDDEPYFMILTQKDARADYRTWGWARRLTGVDLPKVPATAVGAEPVTEKTEDLLLTPKKALELYAKTLSDGDDGDPKKQIADDPFRTQLHSKKDGIRGERAALEDLATVKEKYAVVKGEIAGLRTDDGGAIVLGSLTSERVIEITEDGATLTLADDDVFTRALDRKTFTKEFVRRWGSTVALYIPSKDAGGKIQPIGFTRLPTGADGS
jgi:hypothetical protein